MKKEQISVKKTALTFGLTLAIIHVIWVILVAIGLAKPLVDLKFRLHFISMPFGLEPFNIVTAIGLIIFVFIVGYIIGAIFGFVWNKLQD
ncbi:hypothetical protein HY498_00375 [Candidatus Woesearchaeota archaeon]|nr:hypothetical protein [Candidatus Woesearchaeota archaeon]